MNDDCDIVATITGSADLLAFGSGNPKPLTNFNTNKTRTFNGRALLILAKNQQLSSIQIAVHSNNDSKKDEIVGQLTI